MLVSEYTGNAYRKQLGCPTQINSATPDYFVLYIEPPLAPSIALWRLVICINANKTVVTFSV